MCEITVSFDSDAPPPVQRPFISARQNSLDLESRGWERRHGTSSFSDACFRRGRGRCNACCNCECRAVVTSFAATRTRSPTRHRCRTGSRYTGRSRSSQAGAGPLAPRPLAPASLAQALAPAPLAPALGLAAAPLASPLAPSPQVGRLPVTSIAMLIGVTGLPRCLRKPILPRRGENERKGNTR